MPRFRDSGQASRFLEAAGGFVLTVRRPNLLPNGVVDPSQPFQEFQVLSLLEEGETKILTHGFDETKASFRLTPKDEVLLVSGRAVELSKVKVTELADGTALYSEAELKGEG